MVSLGGAQTGSVRATRESRWFRVDQNSFVLRERYLKRSSHISGYYAILHLHMFRFLFESEENDDGLTLPPGKQCLLGDTLLSF